jgi:hypothetical protein
VHSSKTLTFGEKSTQHTLHLEQGLHIWSILLTNKATVTLFIFKFASCHYCGCGQQKKLNMPFSLFNCLKKKAGDMAEEYGGEAARDLVEDGFEKMDSPENEAGAGGGDPGGLDVGNLMQVFTGRQQGGLTSLFGSLAGSLGGMDSE